MSANDALRGLARIQCASLYRAGSTVTKTWVR